MESQSSIKNAAQNDRMESKDSFLVSNNTALAKSRFHKNENSQQVVTEDEAKEELNKLLNQDDVSRLTFMSSDNTTPLYYSYKDIKCKVDPLAFNVPQNLTLYEYLVTKILENIINTKILDVTKTGDKTFYQYKGSLHDNHQCMREVMCLPSSQWTQNLEYMIHSYLGRKYSNVCDVVIQKNYNETNENVVFLVRKSASLFAFGDEYDNCLLIDDLYYHMASPTDSVLFRAFNHLWLTEQVNDRFDKLLTNIVNDTRRSLETKIKLLENMYASYEVAEILVSENKVIRETPITDDRKYFLLDQYYRAKLMIEDKIKRLQDSNAQPEIATNNQINSNINSINESFNQNEVFNKNTNDNI